MTLRHLLSLALLALALVFPVPAGWALEGDPVSAYASGEWSVVEYLQCDGQAPVLNASCREIDWNAHNTAAGTINAHPGLPEYVVFDIRADTCDTLKVVGRMQGLSTSGGTAHTLLATMQSGSTVTSFTWTPITHRFTRFNVTTAGTLAGSCTDFEVVARAFYRRVR